MVVDNLQLAKQLAFGGYKGNKVVTIDGKMIDEFGLISNRQRPTKGLVKCAETKSFNDN